MKTNKKWISVLVLALALVCLAGGTWALAAWTQKNTNSGNTVKTDQIYLMSFGQTAAYFTDSEVLTPDNTLSKQIEISCTTAAVMQLVIKIDTWSATCANYEWSTDGTTYTAFTQAAQTVYTSAEAKTSDSVTLYVRINSDLMDDYRALTALSGFTFTFDLTLQEATA